MGRYYCTCGRLYAEVSDNATVSRVRCDKCPTVKHEGGFLAVVDEWAHRRGMGGVNGHLRPLLWWLTPFPYLCSIREHRLSGIWPWMEAA